MASSKLLDRFLRYVQVDTTADESATRYPSSEGQLRLGRMLVEELKTMGVADARQDQHGLVWASLASNAADADLPTLVLNAHLDTSPEASGTNVQPQVVPNYQGGDLKLPGDDRAVIRVEANPELERLHGATLITSDGTTLLGADDKAGVAIIMETADRLLHQPEGSIVHGPIRLLFTCDEEIGRGVDHVDVAELNATVCYTLDGPGAGHIDVETFSADVATVHIRGINIHPAIAKDRMVNAVKVASAFVNALPTEFAPEHTAGRDGFVHPYVIEGGVGSATLRVLIRDFQTAMLTDHAQRLHQTAREVKRQFPGCEIDIDIAPQYRNLGDGLAREPRAVQFAEEAFRRCGRHAARSIIRGGTDGSRLTELGLPTPNLSSGQHNPHSHLEWACLDEMQQAVDVNLALVAIWGEAAR